MWLESENSGQFSVTLQEFYDTSFLLFLKIYAFIYDKKLFYA